MQSRMSHPVMIVPDAMQALQALSRCAGRSGLPAQTRDLVHLRASQINGCSVCVDMHARDLKKAGESDERLFAVGAWRDAPYFSDAERAALALAESATRLAKESDGVVVVHGTDRLQFTGERIVEIAGTPATPIVLTGAMRPYELRATDALQNLTEALLAVQIVTPGVYLAMHNQVLQFPGVIKDRSLGTFVKPP